MVDSSEDPEKWHEEVSLHRVQDAATGETLGYFYMDLFPREGKYGHAAMWDLQSGSLDRHGRRQAAVAAMVCNFPRPSATTPSLLEHKQVGGKTTFIITIVGYNHRELNYLWGSSTTIKRVLSFCFTLLNIKIEFLYFR